MLSLCALIAGSMAISINRGQKQAGKLNYHDELD
jgi:hypothetical protein